MPGDAPAWWRAHGLQTAGPPGAHWPEAARRVLAGRRLVVDMREEHPVKSTLALLSAALLVSVSVVAASRQQVQPASAHTVNVEEAMKAFRADLQASRADIIAKNVQLTAEQAAKFWPLFERYQKDQSAIIDAQLKGVQEYAEKFDKLDDATAMALVKAHLDRDGRMNALRQQWLGEFQKVLPGRLAARVMQVDRRISLAQQMEISAQIPLIY
jgi:Spy/CpxP family protein refolding chaperone